MLNFLYASLTFFAFVKIFMKIAIKNFVNAKFQALDQDPQPDPPPYPDPDPHSFSKPWLRIRI
jgi:hypothetical protein